MIAPEPHVQSWPYHTFPFILCGRLFSKMATVVLPMILCNMTSALLRLRDRIYFPSILGLDWPCVLFWRINRIWCSNVRFQRLKLKRPCSFQFPFWGPKIPMFSRGPVLPTAGWEVSWKRHDRWQLAPTCRQGIRYCSHMTDCGQQK